MVIETFARTFSIEIDDKFINEQYNRHNLTHLRSNGLDGKTLIVYDRSKLPIESILIYNVIISTFDIYLFLYFGRLIKYY